VYPWVEPFEHGMLDVGEGHRLYWEVCGSPEGRPAVVLHGGPGSGCGTWQRRLFDPERYRVVLFDQRNCGRSTPHASLPDVDLSTNDTPRLVADIERLREHLGVDRWLVTGGSWGSALAIAYGEAHAERVTAMALWGVNSARTREFDWLFRGGLGETFFPEHWRRLRDAVPERLRDVRIDEAYAELLFDADPTVRAAAAEAWCRWESATPSWPPSDDLDDRFLDRAFALAFARLVTHYVRHDAWLGGDVLLDGLRALAGVPAVLIQGRFDFQAPLGGAFAVHERWPSSELVVGDEAGHDAGAPGIEDAIVRATYRFAAGAGVIG
jgi:proline iminopeptidase